MRNSWKLWTAVGTAVLVAAGPAVSGAFAAEIPSPQQGTVLPMPAGPPNAFDPNPQGGNQPQANHDASGGPQSGGPIKHAEQQGQTDTQPTTPSTNRTQPATGAPSGQVPPSSMGNLPNRQQTPYQTHTPDQQQPTEQKADPSAPQDPKMPDGKDMNLPDVTAPPDGPGPVGPVGPKGA
jgi:hypothetical protein